MPDTPAIQAKLKNLRDSLGLRATRVAIVGLGSVGSYLLNYLLSSPFPLRLFLLGRNRERMQADYNITRVAADLRGHPPVPCELIEVDLNDQDQLSAVLDRIDTDFLVNASRAHAHIKYGSISWNTVRAYGIWAPLAVKFARNLMRALAATSRKPIVINTSYSDAVNAWLRTAGLPFPDFGSGNLNHLVPRIRLAAAALAGVEDPENIDITLATSHFHDVVISREGQDEGVPPLLSLRYRGDPLEVDPASLYQRCAIPMPVDARRNMMNASSNYEIIARTLQALGDRSEHKLHIPGALGLVGGYPVRIQGGAEGPRMAVDEAAFTLAQMEEVNARSIYLDGIRGVTEGRLTYTDELIVKVREQFGYDLPRAVHLLESDLVAQELIDNVIEKKR